MTTFVLLIIDAVILMCLMRFLITESVGLLSSFIAAVIGAFAAMFLTAVFGGAVGPNAPVVAGLLTALGVGIGIYFVFNVGFINAIIIGIIFLVVRSGVFYLLGTFLHG